MTTSAIALGLAGICLTFMPVEFLNYIGVEATKPLELFAQILGALYFGFAMLNWMTRSSIIGGIYNRPIAVANFTHFLIAGLALIKGIMASPGVPSGIWCMAGGYSILAICFTVILFRHPASTPAG